MRIQPRTAQHQEAKRLARDLDVYHLTAVLVADSAADENLFNLEGALSFIEHLDVLVTPPVPQTGTDPFSLVPKSIRLHHRNSGGGAVIGEDTFFHDSRASFVQKALGKLQDQAFCERTQFKTLFFKCVEPFRQRKPFIEVSYFLLFSGLESFARAVRSDRATRNAAVPICALLKSYGFDLDIDRPNDLARAVSTYTRLRNALFHNSELVTKTKVNSQLVELKLFDYFFNFSQLVSLSILKAVDFDDGHINWNSWIDRQPFK